jgi:hypothetical protein
MTNDIWTEFEDCVLKLEDLQNELQHAKAAGNVGLARTISHKIKEVETNRDRLLCCLGEVAGAGGRLSSIAHRGRPAPRLAEAAD